ncbi:MAG: helix-turn-helix domain-containing protein [Solirubrobacteraceae bacterium]|nr:helix-turn-helix domain-containing protein [Solirubrobacteraceae bacterium]
MTERTSGGSQTLERGLRLLRVLADHPDGLSVSELAAALDTHRAGIYRLLGPLVDQRLAVRGENGRYVLGAGLIELASRVRPRLQEVAVARLRTLADELRATTALTVRDGEEAVVAAVVEPRNSDMHISYRAGLRHRLDQAASGVAILAGLPPRPGERATIREARERGWAVTSSELLPGATGVGVPVLVPGRECEAAVTAVWTDGRDPASAAPAVAAAARESAAALG